MDPASVLRNGVPSEAAMPMSDPIVMRGDGCFEALRSYGGRLFGLDEHLERLAASAAALDIALPSLEKVGRWANSAAAAQGDGVVRILASGGPEGTEVYVFAAPLPDLPETLRLGPVAAPWHPGGEPWELAGIKTLSYAPNMAAGRMAQARGFDDALLLSRSGEVLECPTSSVLWVADGVIETPSLDLGILGSITRRTALALAARLQAPVREGRFPLARLELASEAALLSSIKEIVPVTAVGEWTYPPGPVTARLAAAYRKEVERLAPA